MADAYCLQVDREVCNDCGICDKMLTGFLSNNNGRIQISGSNYQKEHVAEAVHSVIKCCPEEAISLSQL